MYLDAVAGISVRSTEMEPSTSSGDASTSAGASTSTGRGTKRTRAAAVAAATKKIQLSVDDESSDEDADELDSEVDGMSSDGDDGLRQGRRSSPRSRPARAARPKAKRRPSRKGKGSPPLKICATPPTSKRKPSNFYDSDKFETMLFHTNVGTKAALKETVEVARSDSIEQSNSTENTEINVAPAKDGEVTPETKEVVDGSSETKTKKGDGIKSPNEEVKQLERAETKSEDDFEEVEGTSGTFSLLKSEDNKIPTESKLITSETKSTNGASPMKGSSPVSTLKTEETTTVQPVKTGGAVAIASLTLAKDSENLISTSSMKETTAMIKTIEDSVKTAAIQRKTAGVTFTSNSDLLDTEASSPTQAVETTVSETVTMTKTPVNVTPSATNLPSVTTSSATETSLLSSPVIPSTVSTCSTTTLPVAVGIGLSMDTTSLESVTTAQSTEAAENPETEKTDITSVNISENPPTTLQSVSKVSTEPLETAATTETSSASLTKVAILLASTAADSSNANESTSSTGPIIASTPPIEPTADTDIKPVTSKEDIESVEIGEDRTDS